MQTAEELSKKLGKRTACTALGVPRSSLYRAQKPGRVQASPKAFLRALSQPEKDAVRRESSCLACKSTRKRRVERLEKDRRNDSCQ